MSPIRSSFWVAVIASVVLSAGCNHEVESPPVAAKTVVPDLVCVEQLTTTVTLTGSGFTPAPEKTLEQTELLVMPKIELDRTVDLTGAAATSTFTIPDDPKDPANSRLHWTSDTQMSFQVFPELKLQPGLYDIKVTNPDGVRAATFTGGLAAVPRPTVTAVAPDILCDAQSDQTVVLTGMDFIQVGTTLPVIHTGKADFPANKLDGCKEVPGTHAEGSIKDCTSATFVIPQGKLDPGTYDITITNPKTADCVSSDKIQIVVVPPPTVAAIAPDLVCDAQGDQTMTVTGTNFLTIGTAKPQVVIGDKTFDPASVDGCVAVPDQGMLSEGMASACTTIKLVIPAGTFPEGDYKVLVKNPPPANCESQEMVNLHVAPPPEITGVMPIGICDTQGDQTLVITGNAFLQVGMALPTVTIGNMPFKPTSATGCMKVPGTFTEGDVEECTGLTIVVPKGTFTSGKYPVTVQNPDPAGCKTEGMITLLVDDPPVVTNVVPQTLCAGGGGLKINGSGFQQGAMVSLQSMGKPTLKSDMTTVNMAGTQIDAHVMGGGNAGDVYDLVVDNGDGCTDSPPHQKVTITAGPIAFFADPDVVFSGINTRVTVYATAIVQPLPANAVQIVPTGQAAPLTSLTFAPSPGHPNRIQVVVPAGQAAGVYDLILNDATGCPTKLTAAITVTNTLDVTIKAVVPPFGYTGSETDVTIQRDVAAPAPGDKPFVATPRVFLNPSNPGPADVAIQLESVSFTSADQLTAIVPRNQPAHLYDLIVVNPDGTVGLLTDAFTVQSVAPPTVSSVTPSSIVAASGQVVTVAGKNFVASQISLTCKDAMGNAVAPPMVGQGAIACDAQQNCTQKATIDGSALPVGSVCVLRITNGDGAFFDFSAIGVTNPSLNLPATHAGSSLNVGRRALVAGSGNATAAARYIYAVGGDGGMAMQNAPFNSVEVAPVDPFGNFGTWQTQKPSLATGRAFAAGTTVGRYIYVLGGTDGATALATGERARILDPTEVPSLDIDDLVPDVVGLDPGYWLYRVSATFSAADQDNPLGESLPSDEFIVKVPTFVGKKIKVILAWAAPKDALDAPLPNVAGYRIYRTPMVNGKSGDEVLLATVSGATLKYTDDGSAVPGAEKPVPLGNTGNWYALPAMAKARKGAAAAAAFDPAGPNKLYVYALMGLDAGGAALGSYEYLSVTVQPNGHQTIGTWTTGAQQSATGRWQLNAWVADTTVSSLITPPSTYVYVGGGELANNTLTGKVEAGLVAAGGDLGALSDGPKDFSSTVAGYGVCAANGQLFAFGGAGGAPSNGAKSAAIIAPPPALSANSWNSEGITLVDSRYLMGSTVQSAFIFLIGGQTGASAASKTTELVIW